MDNLIITEKPFWPLLTEEDYIDKRLFYGVRELCKLRNCTTDSLYEYTTLMPVRIMNAIPSKFLLNWKIIKIAKATSKRLYYLVSYDHLDNRIELIRNIRKYDKAPIILDIPEDTYYQRKLYPIEGKKWISYPKEEYYKKIKVLLELTYVTVPSREFPNGWKEEGLDISRVIPMENSGDPDLFYYTPLPEEKNIVLFSNILNFFEGQVRGVEILLEAIRHVAKEYQDVRLYIFYISDREYRKKLLTTYQDLNLVISEKPLPYLKLPRFLSKAYLCVDPIKVTPALLDYKTKHQTTALKFFDYIAAGRPVVQTDYPSTSNNIMVKENCGFLCKDTPEDMADKIITLLNDREMAQQMGLNGRTAIEREYNWANRVKDVYNELCKREKWN